jgi:hypothetical protein
MSELTLSASDIASAITKGLEGYAPSVEARTVGRVAEIGDGIARVSGLPDCAVNELLEFEDGSVGLALNLDEDSIGVVVLGNADALKNSKPSKPRAAFCRCQLATPCLAESSMRLVCQSTAREKSLVQSCAELKCKHPASWVANRYTSHCRRALSRSMR